MKPVRVEDDLRDMRQTAQALAVIAAWANQGYFKVLADGEPHRLEELGSDLRALRVTAPILAHVGLLAGDGVRWAFSARGRALAESGALASETPEDFGDLSRLPDVLAHGGPVKNAAGVPKATSGGVIAANAERTRRFMAMTYRRAEVSSRETAQWTAARLPAGARVLDLGGGHGRYARAFSDRGFRATVFDRQICVDFARELHGDAVAYRAGDFMTDDLGGPYDAVLLSDVLHGCSADENRLLLGRVRDALAPGGLLVLKDMFIDELGNHPQQGVLYGLVFLLYSMGGQCYSVREAEAWCAPAFGAMETVSLEEYTLLFLRRTAS